MLPIANCVHHKGKKKEGIISVKSGGSQLLCKAVRPASIVILFLITGNRHEIRPFMRAVLICLTQ